MASISDKITKTMDGQTPNTTTVSTQRVAGATELQARNLDGWPEDTAVHFTTYRVDSQGEVVDGSETDWKGVVNRSANTIASLTRTGGAPDQGNAADDVIEPMPTAAWGNELAEALLECHTTEGNLKPKSVALTNINGGTTAGILKTDATGAVSPVTKLPAENIDLTSLNKPQEDGWNVYVNLINGKKRYWREGDIQSGPINNGGFAYVDTSIQFPDNTRVVSTAVRVTDQSISATAQAATKVSFCVQAHYQGARAHVYWYYELEEL